MSKYSDRYITIRREHLDKLREKIVTLDLDYEVASTSPETFCYLWQVPCHGDNFKRAKKAAENYVDVLIIGNQKKENVVGWAELEGYNEKGEPLVLYYTTEFAPDPGPWSRKRMKEIDFSRCDACGKRIQRKKVYIVEDLEGELYQYGGTCADNLNLAAKVSKQAKDWKLITRWVQEEFEEDPLFRQKLNHIDPRKALLLADYIVKTEGFVSTKEEFRESTKESVAYLLLHPRGKEQIERILDTYTVEEKENLYREVDYYLDSLDEGPFKNNLKVALETGNKKLLGYLVFIPEGIRRFRTKSVTEGKAYEEETIAEKKAYPDIKLSLGNANIKRHIPGIWTVTSVRVSPYSTYFTVYYNLRRNQDGALITWKSSNEVDCAITGEQIEAGDEVYIRSATLGNILQEKKVGTRTYPATRRISRAKLVKVIDFGAKLVYKVKQEMPHCAHWVEANLDVFRPYWEGRK